MPIEKTKFGANILPNPKIFILTKRYFNWIRENTLVIALSEETQFYNVFPLELHKTRFEEDYLISLVKNYKDGNFPINKEDLKIPSKKQRAIGLETWNEYKKKAVIEAI